MNSDNTKYPQLSGSSYSEVLKRARQEYNVIAHSTKRQPYVKSKYFSGEKVFLAVFWTHLMNKNQKDRTKRLRFYKAALDLLRNSQINPDTITSTEDQRMLLYRLSGVTKDGSYFCVQVKEDKRTKRKDFMSVFDRKPH